MGEIGEDFRGNRYWKNDNERLGESLYVPRSQAERDSELVEAWLVAHPITQYD